MLANKKQSYGIKLLTLCSLAFLTFNTPQKAQSDQLYANVEGSFDIEEIKSSGGWFELQEEIIALLDDANSVNIEEYPKLARLGKKLEKNNICQIELKALAVLIWERDISNIQTRQSSKHWAPNNFLNELYDECQKFDAFQAYQKASEAQKSSRQKEGTNPYRRIEENNSNRMTP